MVTRLTGLYIACTTTVGQLGVFMFHASRKALVAWGLLWGLWVSGAQGATLLSVSFDDPLGQYATYRDEITLSLQAAGAEWLSLLDLGANVTLTVQVGFLSMPTASGASASASFDGSSAGLSLYEQGAAAKLKTGVDVNGDDIDVRIYLGVDGYLQNDLWFDPTPYNLTDDVVPATQIDARSVFLHELGHALGFNGWRDDVSGALPASYASTYDALVGTLPGESTGNLYFFGAAAQAVYGGPVPLTFGSYRHVGNAAGQVGGDLLLDLMNGVYFLQGRRYTVSELDLAILRDVGLASAVATVPEPETRWQMAIGILMLAAVRRRRLSRLRPS